jgi:hypothetical protein
MRQFPNVSYSPWANPYTGAVESGRPAYYQPPAAAPLYRRVVAPTPPVFFHRGIEQLNDPHDEETLPGVYTMP